ncbi:hypothetical protein ACSSS7_004708 [Eimeria intestinalis]
MVFVVPAAAELTAASPAAGARIAAATRSSNSSSSSSSSSMRIALAALGSRQASAESGLGLSCLLIASCSSSTSSSSSNSSNSSSSSSGRHTIFTPQPSGNSCAKTFATCRWSTGSRSILKPNRSPPPDPCSSVVSGSSSSGRSGSSSSSSSRGLMCLMRAAGPQRFKKGSTAKTGLQLQLQLQLQQHQQQRQLLPLLRILYRLLILTTHLKHGSCACFGLVVPRRLHAAEGRGASSMLGSAVSVGYRSSRPRLLLSVSSVVFPVSSFFRDRRGASRRAQAAFVNLLPLSLQVLTPLCFAASLPGVNSLVKHKQGAPSFPLSSVFPGGPHTPPFAANSIRCLLSSSSSSSNSSSISDA